MNTAKLNQTIVDIKNLKPGTDITIEFKSGVKREFDTYKYLHTGEVFMCVVGEKNSGAVTLIPHNSIKCIVIPSMKFTTQDFVDE